MKNKSIIFSIIAVWACVVLLVAVCVMEPMMMNNLNHFRAFTKATKTAITIGLYICAVPSFIALGSLAALLNNIKKGNPFEKKNISFLAIVSWCCIAVAIVTVVAGIWYIPLYVFTLAMLFLFLIVRVIIGCFKSAIELKEENSLTI